MGRKEKAFWHDCLVIACLLLPLFTNLKSFQIMSTLNSESILWPVPPSISFPSYKIYYINFIIFEELLLRHGSCWRKTNSLFIRYCPFFFHSCGEKYDALCMLTSLTLYCILMKWHATHKKIMSCIFMLGRKFKFIGFIKCCLLMSYDVADVHAYDVVTIKLWECLGFVGKYCYKFELFGYEKFVTSTVFFDFYFNFLRTVKFCFWIFFWRFTFKYLKTVKQYMFWIFNFKNLTRFEKFLRVFLIFIIYLNC